MKLSIVATLYQSAPYVDEFHRRASDAARLVADDNYEIVLVNDGSPDASLERAIRLTQFDPRVVVVDLSRNFGHHKAMMTGLALARGESVFLIDSDLEEDPEWLLAFSAQLERDRCDVVYGVQRHRKGGWFERWSGQIYYKLMPILSGIDLPQDMVTARLMTRRYVDALLLHEEREIDIGGLWAITGFGQQPHPVTKLSTSETTYTLLHRAAVMVNSITSFSNFPLLAISYVGIGIFCIAGSYTAYIVVQWVFMDQPLSGWTSLIASIWLLGAMIILFLGIIGIYLAKIFSEVKRRPYTIIREIHGREPR
jgi:putative glycosyltransferase